MSKKLLTTPVEYLREALRYEPATGFLYWRKRPVSHFKSARDCKAWNTRYADICAGATRPDGYAAIRLAGKTYKAARLAWALYTGEWPAGIIDHINGVKDDDRIENLRDVPHKMNSRNMTRYRRNTSGITGVYKKSENWVAQIGSGENYTYLGYFRNFDDAVVARRTAEKERGFTSRHGTAR